MFFPKVRFLENNGERFLSTIEGAVEAAQEPFHPGRYVEIALLRRFQYVVVGIAFEPDLSGHAVKALCALFRARERHISDSSRDASVAVLERMDGDEPQMRERCPE